MFSLVPLAFVPVIARCHDAAIDARAARISAFFSTTSYSVYLIHWDILQLFRGLNPFVRSYGLTTIVLLLCFAVTYAAAYVLYCCWEPPFLAYRNTGRFRLSLVLDGRRTTIT